MSSDQFEWAERQGINPYEWARDIQRADSQGQPHPEPRTRASRAQESIDFDQWEQEL